MGEGRTAAARELKLGLVNGRRLAIKERIVFEVIDGFRDDSGMEIFDGRLVMGGIEDPIVVEIRVNAVVEARLKCVFHRPSARVRVDGVKRRMSRTVG